MFDLYSFNTPNGQKVLLALEEAGAEYAYHTVDIRAGEQHLPWFRKLSPDGKIPVLCDQRDPDVCIFESGAILLYLAGCFPQLYGTDPTQKNAVQSWTFWQVGQLGPLIGQYGQLMGRKSGRQSDDVETRAHFEAGVSRCLKVLNQRLSDSPYLAGSSFSIADIACYPWIQSPQSYLNVFEFDWRSDYLHLVRWTERLSSRDAFSRVMNG